MINFYLNDSFQDIFIELFDESFISEIIIFHSETTNDIEWELFFESLSI